MNTVAHLLPLCLWLCCSYVPPCLAVMDGIVATRNLRGLGITIPLIAVTGNAMEDDLHVFKSAGINRILTKPVQRAVLQATLKEYLPNFRPAVSAAEIKMKQRK